MTADDLTRALDEPHGIFCERCGGRMMPEAEGGWSGPMVHVSTGTADCAVIPDNPCPTCGGTGVDPKLVQRGTDRHRYTTGGHDEEAPCTTCGGTGEGPGQRAHC